jgi:hypothetical protein
MLTLFDVHKYLINYWANIRNIPHEQGFYLLFDVRGIPIYVGEGWLDERIKTHFNSNAGAQYYDDACYCFWVPTFDKNIARAYEKAIYDDFASKGTPLIRNRERPTGVSMTFPNCFAKARLELEAMTSWRSLLRGIAIRKLVVSLIS